VLHQLKSDKIDHNLEFEWLLCLANRFQTSQCLRPTEVRGIRRPEEFPHINDQQFFGRESEGAVNVERKESRPQSQKAGVSVPLSGAQS
jgi:hypothetical protein